MEISSIMNAVFELAKNEVILVVAFIVVAFLLFKIFKMLGEIIGVAIISAAIPLILANVFKVPIALTLNTFLFFMLVGVGALLLVKAFNLITAPFKLLTGIFSSKIGIISLVIAIGLASWFFYFSSPVNLPVEMGGKIDRSCFSDSDCSYARIDCCDFCSTGMAVNRRSYELINSEKQKRCNINSCPASNCSQPSIITGNILSSDPGIECYQGKCMPELNCVQLCSYFSQNKTSFIAETAKNLYLTETEILERCGC